MIKKICGTISLLFLINSGLCADVGIIPYRVENPSDFFPETMGEEYAKLLYVASLLKKKMTVASPRDLALDMKRHGVSPDKVISPENLELLGQSGLYDYFLLGGISKIGEKFVSESTLYSVRSRKAVLKIQIKSASLISLAEKEVAEAFVSFKNREEKKQMGAALDLVYIVDTSYAVSKDWESVKNAIVQNASRLIDSLRIDTRIKIIPFSDRTGLTAGFESANSVISLRNDLEKLKPIGGTSAENFTASLRHMAHDVRWRGGAGKIAFIISNSNVNGARFAETYALAARKKGITIFSISLGGLNAAGSDLIKNIAGITNGSYAGAAYHQRIFDHEGKPIDLYYENGRLFEAKFPSREWRDGLFHEKRRSEIRRPKQFLDEIVYNEKKISINPYRMSKAYDSLSRRNIINENQAENNIEFILEKIFEAPFRSGFTQPLAKVLLADGKISFWLPVEDRESLKFFQEKNTGGFYFRLGVSVRSDASSTYRIALIQRMKNIPGEYVPDMLMASFGDIVKKPDYFMSNGLLFPPVWFVNVKAEQVEILEKSKDIRGE